LANLTREFGNIEGNFLRCVGLGIDNTEIIPYTKAPEVKSVSRNYCLARNEYDKRIVYQNIFELCEEVALKLRRLNKKTRTVGLGLRGSRGFYKNKTVSQYLDKGIELFAICKFLLEKEEENYVRMISVRAGNLSDADYTPQFLFDNPNRKDNLQKTIDKVNEKFGDHTIRNGFLLYADKLTTVPNGYMADRYERSKLGDFF